MIIVEKFDVTNIYELFPHFIKNVLYKFTSICLKSEFIMHPWTWKLHNISTLSSLYHLTVKSHDHYIYVHQFSITQCVNFTFISCYLKFVKPKNVASFSNYLFYCLLIVFTHLETSPLPVKGWKFWHMLCTLAIEQRGFISVLHVLRHGATIDNVLPEDPWHSHFMPSVWQWGCHYLVKRLDL